MLPLPRGLVITRDLETEQKLLVQVRKYLESEARTDGIHVSDLLDPMLGYWRRVKPRGLPDRLVNVFMVGKVAHGIIELVSASGNPESEEPDAAKIEQAPRGIHLSDTGTQVRDGIHFSVDAYLDNAPAEIKTTRSFYPPRVAYLPDDDTWHMYAEQLLAYMALTDSVQGRLIALYLNMKDENGRTFPTFYVWLVTTTPEALAAYRRVLNRTRDLLLQALEKNDPSGLPLCRAFKCRECDYFNDCKPEGRYGVPEKVWLKQTKLEKARDRARPVQS